MILKKIAHKVAQAFRLAQAADKKLSTGIAAALDAKAEQLREYEKSFEPEPPEPDPLLEARTSLAQAGFSAAAATYALRRFAEALKPEPYSVPVDSQEDIRKVKAYGGNPVVVPAGVAKLLKKEKDKRIKALTEIPCANVMTLKDKFNRWYDVYAEDIRDEARMEIRNLIDELE